MRHSLAKINIILFSLLLTLPLSAQDLTSFVDSAGKIGYHDESGKIIIIAQFDDECGIGDYFPEGLQGVKQNGKWGFIDKKGSFVIPPQFDNADFFSEGLAGVEQNGKWGFIDKKGSFVIPPQFDNADFFSEGLASVQQNGKWGYIDKTGKYIILANFERGYNFSEGLASVQHNGKFGFIDKTGNFIISADYESAVFFSEGLASVQQNGKWGFIDKTGKIVIPARFDNAASFSDGLALVEQNWKWGFIDKKGSFVIPPQFDYVGLFRDGLALGRENGKEFYFDKQGRRYSTRAEGKEFLAREAQSTEAVQPAVAQKTPSHSMVHPPAQGGDYADKMVDVDAEIPAGSGENYGTYAVVIGNEEYLDVAPVANAANDGRVMREYLVKTLGVPESNIIYFENASSAVMDRALSVLEKKVDAAAGVGKKFNVIFYYSGHGVPTEDTQEAYLLPVDVSPSNLKKYGLPLSDVYRRLGALNAQCVTVFLDACFSGAGRDNRMLAEVKGVQLEPKKSAPTGNMVVLSACSGRETANIFKEGKHGLFTYWLLRKLKETKGNVTLGELQEHLQKYVDYTATNRLNLESGQKPTVQTSPTLSTDWRTIRLR